MILLGLACMSSGAKRTSAESRDLLLFSANLTGKLRNRSSPRIRARLQNLLKSASRVLYQSSTGSPTAVDETVTPESLPAAVRASSPAHRTLARQFLFSGVERPAFVPRPTLPKTLYRSSPRIRARLQNLLKSASRVLYQSSTGFADPRSMKL